MFTVSSARAFINEVATFFFSFSGFIVAFSNFLQGESPGRSALETCSKWEEESLIEFLDWQVLLRKPGLEFIGPLHLN